MAFPSFPLQRFPRFYISGGENISSKEIETVINRIDAVRESAVVGIPDEQWGEKVVAVVPCRSGATWMADDIRRHCLEYLHAWKIPKEIRFVEAIPKNRMGTVLTDAVRKLFVE